MFCSGQCGGLGDIAGACTGMAIAWVSIKIQNKGNSKKNKPIKVKGLTIKNRRKFKNEQ